MPFVTKLTLESGDRRRLDSVVDEIKEQAERKGVELKGPHPQPPDHLRVPQSKTLGPAGGRFESWDYTVYTRTIEIVDHEEFARAVAGREFDDGIHVAAEVEQRSHLGS
ncbi:MULTISPECIES: uS10/mL48 family ribosomal protein [Halomicrobium]|uniref:Small ribosomal subunit protein uS10 n=1 Tax=Halomicrobium mukohataei TaxID=57705 RepID=A0A847UJ19_9EURY|nr:MULTISPECIES: uS10/mL48 family ribosomal protein [Halomicrobium]MBO4246869.1 30S ribosomal protein S10 [Halomicrobium sp. IBSBa]NLV11371.1 30S ribosomal protein S10 [Halomicrobium mukohataei]QGA83373.1 Ribosomal protein S10 [Halomicrobium sp. LC1Hm]